jgi:hypothetical protein
MKTDTIILLLAMAGVFGFGAAAFLSASWNFAFLSRLFLLLAFGTALAYSVYFVWRVLMKKP